MYILGVHGGLHRTHDASACLLKDDKIIAFAEEERFTRQKRAFDSIPVNATLFCLKQANIRLKDIDIITFCHQRNKFQKMDKNTLFADFFPEKIFGRTNNLNMKLFNHHLSHASSVFYTSGFNEAAVLVVDGEGLGVSTSIYKANNNRLKLIKEYPVSYSLGYLYAAVASFLDFGSFGAGKLMGLSSYGLPIYKDKIKEIFSKINNQPFNIQEECQKQYIEKVTELLHEHGFISPSRKSEYKTTHSRTVYNSKDRDLAASVQHFLEDELIGLSKKSLFLVQTKNLCISGGVALNCVANSKIECALKPKSLFIQPNCEDSGLSLGSALLINSEQVKYENPYFNAGFEDHEIETYLDQVKLHYRKISNVAKTTAELLRQDKIIGWFQGRAEVGPRALGCRSILANPSNKETNRKINICKGREEWRPFGPSILEEYGEKVLENYVPSPFMLKSFRIKPEWQDKLSAVTHVDGSTRPHTINRLQNPLFYDLIKEFYSLTGIPAVLNTSFNYAGEPIVCSPKDAIRTFYSTNLDVLIIGSYLISKRIIK